MSIEVLAAVLSFLALVLSWVVMPGQPQLATEGATTATTMEGTTAGRGVEPSLA